MNCGRPSSNAPSAARYKHEPLQFAASNGDERARRNRDMLAGQMTAQQVADAQKLAREWKPTSSATVAALTH
jgi:hypothetical protein